MLTFEPFSLETLKKYTPYIRMCRDHVCDMSTGYLFMWQEDSDIRFCVHNDTFTVRRNIGDQPAFSYPYGSDPDGMIDEIFEYVRENDLPLRFYCITDEQLEKIKADPRFDTVMHDYDVRWSDYLYSFENARTFAGRKFSGQRNHINKFKKLYGEPDVRFMTDDDIPKIKELLIRYEDEHPDGNALETLELQNTKDLIGLTDELSLYAACLHVGEEIAAFTIGEIIGDMLIIHVEKALLRYEGAYPTMYNYFVRLIADTTDEEIAVVNREDDSGDIGLRMSKEQYHPVGRSHKRLVHINSPAAEIGEMPVLRRGGIVLTGIFERDKKAYLDLNSDHENNRYWGYDYREDVNITSPPDEDTFYSYLMYDLNSGGSINFAIREREDGDLIGETILWHFTEGRTCELGCRLIPAYHGKGYGTAAFSAAAEYAEKVLSLSVWARCYKENTPSEHMILSSGFRKTGEDDTFFYFKR